MLEALIVLIFFLIQSFVVSPQKESETKTHWITLHYHKTGHDLTEALVLPFTESPCFIRRWCKTRILRRGKVQPEIRLLYACEINRLVANHMIFPWKELLPRQEFRIVHFVRDPFDMIISAFLYHAQDPPPISEFGWLGKQFDPCEYDEVILDSFVEYIDTNWFEDKGFNNKLKVQDMLQSVRKLCVQLRDNALNGTTYHSMLRSAHIPNSISDQEVNKFQNTSLAGITDVHAGLLLEACRSILSGRGGDILRMAGNVLVERKTAGVGQSKRVFLSDFPVSNRTKFTSSITSVYQILMDSDPFDIDKVNSHISEEKGQFFNCLNISTAVDRVMKSMEKDDKKKYFYQPSSSHVTQKFVSITLRKEMMTYMENDPIIGPLLLVVRNILNF